MQFSLWPSNTLSQKYISIRNKIEEKGLVISEFPPHTPIAKYRFPERNRIISGLSKGVLITEAKEQSGSHITIDFALSKIEMFMFYLDLCLIL